jgi:hypothetical protein
MLLPFEFFAWRNRDYAEANRNCFEGGGRGLALDAEIAKLAELPRIHPNYRPEYREALQTIAEPEKRSLYEVCGAIAHGLHGLSDCHHSSFRWIEGWVHGIGTGRLDIPSRRAGTERERLARLLFGYALALDKWLLGKPMQFLLLDLGHVDLGFDPKDGILRVYAYLGEQRTPLKECLAACLWHTLCYHRLGGNAAGLLESRHKHLAERSASLGVSVRDWIDAELAAGGKGRAET